MDCKDCGTRPATGNEPDNEKEFIDLCAYNRMADGRAFTDYRTKCQKLTNMSSYDERMFLMTNAESLMKSSESKYICTSCSLKPDDDASTMAPEKFKQTCDGKTCKFVLNDENGIGLGR